MALQVGTIFGTLIFGIWYCAWADAVLRGAEDFDAVHSGAARADCKGAGADRGNGGQCVSVASDAVTAAGDSGADDINELAFERVQFVFDADDDGHLKAMEAGGDGPVTRDFRALVDGRSRRAFGGLDSVSIGKVCRLMSACRLRLRF